jgi:hypothetical protein
MTTPTTPPLVVAYGLGVDSTAMLVGYAQRGIRPDLIIFSDVGAEREATYAYLPKINRWLRSVGFPEVTVVTYKATDFKHFPAYHTIEENILTNVSLPSIAYGGHTCSSKWKISAQDKFLKGWAPAIAAWSAGLVVRRAVGFEDSPHEHKRAKRCSTFAVQDLERGKYAVEFPLQAWGWSREECVRQIGASGLEVPMKSSCYFCTAMKPWEVDQLSYNQHCRIVILEARTAQRHLAFAEAKGWPNGVGKPCTEGIWRKAVKGTDRYGNPNGAQKKPGSMTEYIREQAQLPAALIDALIELTPTCYFTKADFERDGISGWQEWIALIISRAEALAASRTPVQIPA